MIKILPYQKQALLTCKKLIKEKNKGMILFHSLGSGKTITVLNILENLVPSKNIRNIYIICPFYLFEVWKKESLLVRFPYIKNTKFINIYDIHEILSISITSRDILIVDEAHIIINEYFQSNLYKKSKIQNIYQLLYSSFFTIYVTATPITDNITDLYIFENLCSIKKLPTNDRNLYPNYFTVNKFLYFIFNKILPFLIKYTFKAPYFTIINITTTFIIIYLELYHDAIFDDFHKFISYLKYNSDFIGRNVFLPIKKKIEDNNKNYSHIENEVNKDPDFIKYKKDYQDENIEQKNGELSQDYIKIKKKILNHTKISYIIKIIFGIYYSILTIVDLFREYYLKNIGILKFNYQKFLKNISSIHKYIVSDDNKNFPSKTIHTKYIVLNWLQTKNIVDAIVNKDYVLKSCNTENYILCNLYNIIYKDIPIETILQISNFFHSRKFDELLVLIKKFKTNICISCRYFKNSLYLITLFLHKNNISYKILYPKVKNNSEILHLFENSKFQVLLLHPDIIEGLSIKNTKAIILFDVCTKYNIEQQVIGRVIRFNSHKHSKTKHIHIYKFITIFDRKLLIKALKQIDDPSQSFEELLKDQKKLKFLTMYKTPDQIYEDSNLLIENIYNNL